MTVENISWSISMKEFCRPWWGLNPRPPGLLLDGTSNWAIEASTNLVWYWNSYNDVIFFFFFFFHIVLYINKQHDHLNKKGPISKTISNNYIKRNFLLQLTSFQCHLLLLIGRYIWLMRTVLPLGTVSVTHYILRKKTLSPPPEKHTTVM